MCTCAYMYIYTHVCARDSESARQSMFVCNYACTRVCVRECVPMHVRTHTPHSQIGISHTLSPSHRL